MKRKFRLNNKGITLVEVMAAIAILAVVTVPFLNSFLASARSNQKARDMLRATTVAQNLMESVEAFSLEEICTQINNSAAESKLYLPYGYDAHFELENERGETSGQIVDGNYEFTETDSNTYCLAIQGIEEDGRVYDARILLDASGYRENGEGSKWNYNEKYSLDINVMNENTDVIFVVNQEEEAAVFEAAGWNREDDWDDVKRVFSILVEQDEEKRKSEKVSISLEYRHEDIWQENRIMQGRSLVKTLGELENVYIMYYPNYASVESKMLDCFEVTLKQENEFDLCLVKQKYSGTKSEEFYTASLNINDEQRLTADNIPRVTVRTNIGKNLYHLQANLRQNALHYTYTNGNVLSAEDARRRMGFVGDVPQSLLGQKKKNNPIFKTTIQVYPAGTCNGTDSSKFEQTEPLTQLTNE